MLNSHPLFHFFARSRFARQRGADAYLQLLKYRPRGSHPRAICSPMGRHDMEPAILGLQSGTYLPQAVAQLGRVLDHRRHDVEEVTIIGALFAKKAPQRLWNPSPDFHLRARFAQNLIETLFLHVHGSNRDGSRRRGQDSYTGQHSAGAMIPLVRETQC